MNRSMVRIAAFSMAIAIILGALGAHALKSVLEPATLDSFKTGVHYQALQSLALFIVQLIPPAYLSEKARRHISLLFVVGIVAFCFSIYVLSFREFISLGALARIIGPVTPLGGLCFITGWIYLGVALFLGDSVK